MINAISSLIVVDGKATFNFKKKTNYLRFSKYIIIFLSIISFIIASKGFDILYLFLLADLFCCAFVVTVFYSFYNKNISEKTAYTSIIIGLNWWFFNVSNSRFFKKFISWNFITSRNYLHLLFLNHYYFYLLLWQLFLPFFVIKAKKL